MTRSASLLFRRYTTPRHRIIAAQEACNPVTRRSQATTGDRKSFQMRQVGEINLRGGCTYGTGKREILCCGGLLLPGPPTPLFRTECPTSLRDRPMYYFFNWLCGRLQAVACLKVLPYNVENLVLCHAFGNEI